MGHLRFLICCGFYLQTIVYASTYSYHPYDAKVEITSHFSSGNYKLRHVPVVLPDSKTTPMATKTNEGQIHFPKDDNVDAIIGLRNWDGTEFAEEPCSPVKGQIRFRGKCVIILSTGPCPENYWILLDQSGFPECALRQCPLGQLKFQERCANVSSHGLCRKHEILYVEYSGQVYCDCENLFVYDNDLDQCIPEHAQGACPHGKYVELDKNGDIICTINYCTYDNLVHNPDDNMCYEKTYVGKCKTEKDEFFIHFIKENMVAECASLIPRNIFEVPALQSCPGGSRRDHLNKCRETFRVQRRNPFYYRVPTLHTAANYALARCPDGYVKIPNNSCQKPNSLFGR